MMIAAIALASDLTLVTRNEREYAAIAGLRVTTW
jgi:predicted nucleic acid-binding protein